MALPFWTPIMEMLPDGGIYDPDSGLSYIGPPAQPLQVSAPTSLAATVASSTADIDAQIAAAKIERDRIRTAANKPGLGPKATATRQENLTEAQNSLKALQDEKKTILAGTTTTPTTTTPTTTTPTTTTPTTTPTTVTPVVTSPVVTDPFAAQTQREAVNARAIFASIFQQYFNRPGDDRFVTDLTKFVEDSISKGYTPDTISALLPQTEAYKTRFKGNEGRLAAGLSAYSPSEYLQAEDTYAEILNRFNLGGLATRDQFADLISNRKSASEVADLVQNVYFRIQNADSVLRQQLNTLKIGAGLTDADLAQALLSGKEGAQTLKQKIAGAEVGAEAATRGLSAIRAQNLANLGVTREQARTGFEAIRQTQPTFEKLSDIYNRPAAPATPEARAARTESVQEELEREQFQGLRSEERARLAQQEQAAFMGSSGTQGIGLRRRSQRGLI
jgi:hypothetical protein